MIMNLLSIVLFLGGVLPAPATNTLVVNVPSTTLLQDTEDELEDQREDVKERLAKFAKHIKKKGHEDLEAIEIIDALTGEFDEFGPKDRSAVVKALGAALKVKRPVRLKNPNAENEIRPQRRGQNPAAKIDNGAPDDRLYIASAAALGEMGPESVPLLLKHLDGKTHRKNLRVQEFIANSLGATQDLRGIKPLLKVLDHKNMELQAAGARALAQYEDLPVKDRKKIFKELLDVLMAQKSKKDGDVTDQEAFARYNTISGAFMKTMVHLSGNRENQPERWQTWWNKNKKGDWDA